MKNNRNSYEHYYTTRNNAHCERTPQERGGPDNGFSVDLLCQSQTPCLSGHPPAANCEDLCRTQDSSTLPNDQANKCLGLHVVGDSNWVSIRDDTRRTDYAHPALGLGLDIARGLASAGKWPALTASRTISPALMRRPHGAANFCILLDKALPPHLLQYSIPWKMKRSWEKCVDWFPMCSGSLGSR